MLDNLYPDVVVLAGGGQTPSRPVPPIFPAPPPDYRALLRHPDDFEFSVNGCCVRIWNAAGCLGSVDNQHFGGFHAIKRHLPQALAMGDDGGGGLFLHMAGAAGKGLYYCRAADLDAAEAVKIADSLRGLLAEGQGRARLAAL